MPLLAESSLASETAVDLIAQAEELKRFSLEELAELFSFDLEAAALLLTPLATLLGIDLDLDTTNTHFNPAKSQQASLTFTFGNSDKECAAAPAGEVKDTGDMAEVLPTPVKDIDVVYSYGPGVEQEIEEAGAKGAVESEIHETFFPDALSHFEKEFGTVCPATGGPHDLDAAVIIDKYFDVSVDRPPLASPHFMMSVRIKCNNNCGPGVRMDYQWEIPTIH